MKDINQTSGLVIDMMSPIPHVNPSFMLEANGTVHYRINSVGFESMW
ncbi:MAG TPA: hypothetical protein VJU13_03025 [Candidatus Nitrosocosmicus sp.]|nr:hypothetical protein [Candidatus Nitrosocosmicus sp.]